MDTAVDAAVIRARGNWLKSNTSIFYFHGFLNMNDIDLNQLEDAAKNGDLELLKSLLNARPDLGKYEVLRHD